jgi:uncharacterized membrane protein
MFVSLFIVIHVITVVLWIGGVAFVTTIIFPMLLKMEDPLEKAMMFQRVENKFAKQARIYSVITGVTGGLLLYLKEEYSLIFTKAGIGITLMLIAWFIYTFVLFFERSVFKTLFSQPEKIDASKVFFRLNIFHWFLLGLSLLAVGAGVWAGHGA